MIKAIINPFPLVLPLVLGMVLLCSACSLNANLSCGELQSFWEETQDFSERVQALPAESLLVFSASAGGAGCEAALPGHFDTLEVAGPLRLVFRQDGDGEASLRMNAAAECREYMVAACADGCLTIVVEKKEWRESKDTLQMELFSPVPSVIRVGSLAAVDVPDGIKTGNLGIHVQKKGRVSVATLEAGELALAVEEEGLADIDKGVIGELAVAQLGNGSTSLYGLQSDEISVAVTGSGSLTLSGSCRDASFAVVGKGKIDAEGLASENVSAAVTGRGKIVCCPGHSLDAAVLGFGVICYAGDPKDVSKVGRVRRL